MQNTTSQPTPLVAKFMNETPYFTYAMIGVLVIIHLYVMSLAPGEFNQFYFEYANDAEAVRNNGELYRLFTSMFLHANLTHLLFNCFALYIFGRETEGPLGHVRFLIIYVLGGLTGSVASVLFTNGFSVGASGAVFAIFGAAGAYYYRHLNLYGRGAMERLRSLVILAVINLAIGFATAATDVGVRIDNAAHIGGLVGGVLLAYFMMPVYEVRMGISETGQPGRVLVDTQSRVLWFIYPVIFCIFLAFIVATSF